MRTKRTIGTAAATAALSLAAIGSAQATTWTWAAQNDPLVMSGGKGYGTMNDAGLQYAGLQASLADTKTGDGRVFARGEGFMPDGSGSVEVQSGRRADGQSKFAAMAYQKTYTGSRTVHQFTRWTVNLCRDKPGFDPCSDAQRVRNGRL